MLFCSPNSTNWVGQLKAKFILFGMNHHAFHAIFSRDCVEMLFDDPDRGSVFAINLPGIHGCTDVKLSLENIFQAFGCIC